jgi:uncharacterized protein
LKARTARMHEFADIAALEQTLELLTLRNPALVIRLERRPGQKEARYAHLLSGEPAAEAAEVAMPADAASPSRVEVLEHAVEALREELADLRAQFDEFRKQFQ